MRFIVMTLLLTGCACPGVGPKNAGPELKMVGPEPGVIRETPSLHVSQADLAPCDTRLSWVPEKGAISQTTWQLARQHDKQTIEECADNAAHKADVIRALLGKVRTPKDKKSQSSRD